MWGGGGELRATRKAHATLPLFPIVIIIIIIIVIIIIIDVSGWVGTTPQSSVQTIPDMLDGDEVRTVRGPVINETNVIFSNKMYRVSSCMRDGIIMLKNRHVDVVME